MAAEPRRRGDARKVPRRHKSCNGLPDRGLLPGSEAGGEGPQGVEAGHEAVLTASGLHEGKGRGEEVGRVAGDGHLAVAAGPAEEEVPVAAEGEDVAVVAPLTLDGLELALDVGVEADEDQAPVDPVVLGDAGRQRVAVGHAAADDAVALGAHAAPAEAVAGVGPPNVGAYGAAVAPGVL